MQSRPQRGVAPARKVFYDWDEISTSPDMLAVAFERTNPGYDLVDEDEPTLVRWALPAIGLLIGGFFIGQWWAKRKPAATVVAGEDDFVGEIVGDDLCGFDLLGVM